MDFEQRLQKAIQRGEGHREKNIDDVRAKQLSEEEFKNRHLEYRLRLSEHIESCLRQLPHQFPGFRYETVFGERGWGAACSRDDVGSRTGGKRANFFSRIQVAIAPFSQYHVLELTAKATIRNKEYFNRTYYEELTDADPEKFIALIDGWILEYAELYAAKN